LPGAAREPDNDFQFLAGDLLFSAIRAGNIHINDFIVRQAVDQVLFEQIQSILALAQILG
jgi:hypothetical protein